MGEISISSPTGARGVRGSAISRLSESLGISGLDKAYSLFVVRSVCGEILSWIVFKERSGYFVFSWIIFAIWGGIFRMS